MYLTLTEVMTISACYPDREHFAKAIQDAFVEKHFRQTPEVLGGIFEEVLNENLWNFYET
jgi:hypothetical protein